MAQRVPISEAQKYRQSAFGTQDLITIVAVPSGAAGALVGQALTKAGALTVAGAYECLIPLSGLTSYLEVHLTATIAASTATTAGWTLYYVSDAATPSTWTNKTALSGTGAMVSTTRQTSTLTVFRGEQFVRLTITLGANPNVTFTQAEFNGL